MPSSPIEEASGPLAADTFDDGDSAISNPVSAGLTSLRSSVLRFQEENGRTYHNMSSGKYYLPNDERENERLDLTHNLWLLSLRGELGLSPKAMQGAKRVLDAGTGTGIWAIEYADQHPESEVIGVDLSPIQPSLVPPNCAFEIDDLEKEWTWSQQFDLIFSRYMTGCLAEPEDFVKKAFNNLEPGGYLEMQDILLPYESDDGTLTEDNPLRHISQLCVDAGNAAGRPFTLPLKYKRYLEDAGFVDVVERQLKWPLNTWPKDKHYKEIGAWTQENLHSGIEGILVALFTRYLGWTQDQVTLAALKFRTALKDRNTHGYIPIYVVYGRKPEEPESS
ncbi:unnamed protein product [Parascedosporium putredinis]|uniref:Methyltransferase n=1 Tax=Parascedosporium putredinis TaxID=1442378 RepID=A0A9P1MBK6_9PEZI|nr:unnamed protein product [Parascedosporium putredinis]CAI7996395.1 unnamed protein product [Parascedosporium putredinis]